VDRSDPFADIWRDDLLTVVKHMGYQLFCITSSPMAIAFDGFQWGAALAGSNARQAFLNKRFGIIQCSDI
jgi:hypothetical protein